jgi:hypothetical protein
LVEKPRSLTLSFSSLWFSNILLAYSLFIVKLEICLLGTPNLAFFEALKLNFPFSGYLLTMSACFK